MKTSPFRSALLTMKAITLFLTFLVFSIPTNATGVLDPTFGVNGKASAIVGTWADAKAIVLQADGKIVVVGNVFRDETRRDIALARFNSDGSLDASFGDGGKVYTAISFRDDFANAVAVQADGKIVVVGSTQPFEFRSTTCFLAVRYNPNGSLDSSFGANGIVRVVRGNEDGFNAVAIQPDGKIIAAGKASNAEGAAVVRFNANGELDAGFGNNGLVYVDLQNSQFESFQTISLFPNGRIVVGGLANLLPGEPGTFNVFLVGLEPNGAVAQNFGYQGVVSEIYGLYPAQPYPTKIELAVLPDGGILATTEVSLRRYLSDGSRDETFRGGFGGDNIALRSDGKFILANVAEEGKTGYYLGIALGIYSNRSNPIGWSSAQRGVDIAVQADNKIVVASSDNQGNFFVTRISAITSQGTRFVAYGRDPRGFTYHHDERSRLAVYRPSNRALYVLLDDGNYAAFVTETAAMRVIPEFFGGISGLPPRMIYWQAPNTPNSPGYFRGHFNFDNIEDALQWGSSGDIPVGGDYDGDLRTDFTIYRPSDGVWYFSQSISRLFNAVRWGTSEDKPVPADYDYDGITDIAVFRPSNGTWYVRRSSDGAMTAMQFGLSGDIPLTGDFDGDGRADFVVYRPQNGTWYLLNTTTGFRAVKFGLENDSPVPGDYDGDGRHDIAVFRSGIWYILGSTRSFYAVQWGLPNDVPVAVRYAY